MEFSSQAFAIRPAINSGNELGACTRQAQTANRMPHLRGGHPVRLNGLVIVAADVDPSVIIRQHVAVVIVPVVGVPNSRDEAMEVPPMNTVVTNPGEPMIAADLAPCKTRAARYTTIHKWLSGDAAVHERLSRNTAIHKRLSGDATVHKRVAARHCAPGKAGTSAEAVSAARGAAAMATTTPAVTASTAAVPKGHGASR